MFRLTAPIGTLFVRVFGPYDSRLGFDEHWRTAVARTVSVSTQYHGAEAQVSSPGRLNVTACLLLSWSHWCRHLTFCVASFDPPPALALDAVLFLWRTARLATTGGAAFVGCLFEGNEARGAATNSVYSGAGQVWRK